VRSRVATRDVTGLNVNAELDAGPMPGVGLHKASNLRAFRLSSENHDELKFNRPWGRLSDSVADRGGFGVSILRLPCPVEQNKAFFGSLVTREMLTGPSIIISG
jgi:hypothetical protein